MVICNRCGFENHDVAKICNKCNLDLNLNDETVRQEAFNNNTITLFIKILSIGILVIGILVIGMIVALLIPSSVDYPYQSFGTPLMFTMIFLTLVSFALLRGLAEIIQKLHQSEIHQKKMYELMKEVHHKSD